MTTAMLILMVLAFHTAPAFGQMATSTATSTPPWYDVSTAGGYFSWAVRYAAAQCAPEPPGGFPVNWPLRYGGGTPTFAWRGGAVAPAGESALVPECDRDRILCHTGPPYTHYSTGEEVGLGRSCAELGLPLFGMPVVSTSDRPHAYDVRTGAGYREGAIRYAAALCAGEQDPFALLTEPPGGFPAVTDMRQAKFAWMNLSGRYELRTGCWNSDDDGPGWERICFSEPPYTDHLGQQVGLGMSCAQLRLPPINAQLIRGGDYYPGTSRYPTRVESLPGGYNWYGQPELPPLPLHDDLHHEHAHPRPPPSRKKPPSATWKSQAPGLFKAGSALSRAGSVKASRSPLSLTTRYTCRPLPGISAAAIPKGYAGIGRTGSLCK